MLDFLKRFGLGIVYVLISPFLLLFLSLWCIYTLFIFIVEIFKGIKSFFKGKPFFPEFEEDIRAKEILHLVNNNEEKESDIKKEQNSL